jgi:hypothetical protein
MTDAYVRPAVVEDAVALSEDMRPHDIEECSALGHTPLEALLTPFLMRQDAFTITDPDGAVYAMFGVTHDVTRGIPWMLTSNRFPEIAVPFAQQSRRWFDLLAADYPLLENIVSENNKISHRWLRHLGFTINKSEPLEIGGVTFYRFWRHNV